MRILVTRPKDDCEDLVDALRVRGHQAFSAPMLHIEFLNPPEMGDALTQALIFTSRNGVRALQHFDHTKALHSLPVYVVGEATADAAREAGFREVHVGEGAALELVDLILAHADPAKGRLIHFSGEQQAVNLQRVLEHRGFLAETLVVYRSVASKALPSDIVARLRDGQIDVVLLMSPRAAATFVNLMGRLSLMQAVRGLRYVCISEAVARALKTLAPPDILVAARPNLTEMLEVVNRMEREADHKT